jgi:hypothetical protein
MENNAKSDKVKIHYFTIQDLIIISQKQDKLFSKWNVCLESSERVRSTVPRWVVEGLKVYYFEARPHFIGTTGVATYKRLPTTEETNEVMTSPLFVNSQGNTDFRVKAICDQFTAMVCDKWQPSRHAIILQIY